MRADTSTPVTRLELEHWALGRLEPERRAALEAMGQDDPELRARMDRVRGEIERAAVDMPTLELPEEDEAPARASFWDWLRRPALLGGLAVAAAAALALFLVLPPPDEPQDMTWMGGEVMDLELIRVRLGESQPQGALVMAQAGDRLQLVVSAPDEGWLQIYDVQDDGVVHTWLEPREVAAKQPVQRDVLLDDYAGSERIYVLYSAEPVTLEAVEQATRQAFRKPLAELDRLPLSGDVLQRSVLVVKEAGP